MKDTLRILSKNLLAMHRRFLELERRQAEVFFEMRISPFDFLQMLTQDRRFDWLHPLSALIAEIDAFSEDTDEVSASDLDCIHNQIRYVLTAEESRIARRLRDHLAQDPEFFLAMGPLNNFVKLERPLEGDIK